MSYLIGVAGLLGLGAVYVGLGLADRGRGGCGGCAMRRGPDPACGACSTNRSVAGDGVPTAERGESPGHETAPWETEGDEWKAGREPRQPGGGGSR